MKSKTDHISVRVEERNSGYFDVTLLLPEHAVETLFNNQKANSEFMSSSFRLFIMTLVERITKEETRRMEGDLSETYYHTNNGAHFYTRANINMIRLYMLMMRKYPVANLFLYPQEESALRQYAVDQKASLTSIVRTTVIDKLRNEGYLKENV